MNRIIKISFIFVLIATSITANCQNFFWSHNKTEETFQIEYGLLYNWYAATDERKITSSDDWTLMTEAQWQALKTYIGGNSGKLKEVGFSHWDSPNTGATDEFGFGARGYGTRYASGIFNFINEQGGTWGLFSTPSLGVAYDIGSYNTTVMNRGVVDKRVGNQLVFTKSAVGVLDGTATTYTGNNGFAYNAVAINQLYWVIGLAETFFRNGDTIPWYGANPSNYFTSAEWAALTTSGCCAYDNVVGNVGVGFTFP